jgi:hypothetical protein
VVASDEHGPPLRFAEAGSVAYFFLAADHDENWRIRASADWLHFGSPTAGVGPALIALHAVPNVGEARTATISIARRRGDEYKLARQASALPMRAQQDAVEQVPFATVPRTMELGIAAKFVAKEISKIPEPFDLIALAIAEVIVILVGVGAISLRELMAPDIPEPTSWLAHPPLPSPLPNPLPPPLAQLIAKLPVTVTVQAQETILTAIYLAQQVLTGSD